MYRTIQRDCFAVELPALGSGQSVPQSSKLSKVSPFVDQDGILRVGGRLQESGLSYEAKHPIILGKHVLTELLVERMHIDCMHQGVEAVLSHLQKSFWITIYNREVYCV